MAFTPHPSLAGKFRHIRTGVSFNGGYYVAPLAGPNGNTVELAAVGTFDNEADAQEYVSFLLTDAAPPSALPNGEA